GRDTVIAGASSYLGGMVGKGVGLICRTGPWCATAIGSAVGAVSSGGSRALTNLLDGDPATGLTDNLLGSCILGGLIGGIVGRLTFRLPKVNPSGIVEETAPSQPRVQRRYNGQVFTTDCVGACEALGGEATNPFLHPDFRRFFPKPPASSHYA